ncbi:DUF3108 domain-containing protein [Rhodoplanes sp. TEM]|uniref:DUF3108 domain-containing protein n=1 Tax=Rhodoplanes tepidamans TaxID=200616 RepID=A0ABT5J5J6_RHOTP|nr:MULTISPECIES: DUF3108 domain-containing protein [Rhodoplanes]MDC7784579.1 DUF3108 domain-containing protein [Rhodoplanes tepidamans]MDC7988041.1 DUF3108 domain-containing protein [Rhodoplanes sp. TEM]MDQ0355807.1 hypothetical protein [Rhodoplanes tepidamans]
MSSGRLATRPLLCVLAAIAGLGGAEPAMAQGKLDARYVATLAGIPIGRGAWVIDIADDQYTAAASGTTAGIVRLFASGQGSSASRGHVRNGNLSPSTYASSLTSDKKSEELRIVLQNGTVKDVSVEPPSPPQPERLPVTDAHRRGVTDPMSAALIRVPGAAQPVGPEACARKLAIFDGRMRFDLQLSFKRLETVRAERGYAGPVAVCAVAFRPIAGYVPDRPAITYLTRQREIEAWMAPLAGTRVVVPYKIMIPTPFGLGVLEATQFVSLPSSTRPTPTSARIP